MKRRLILGLVVIIFGGGIFAVQNRLFESKKEAIQVSSDGDKEPKSANNNIQTDEEIKESETESVPEETSSEADDKTVPSREDNLAQNDEISSNKNLGGIENHLVSWGHEMVSGRKIDTVIIHSTYNATGGDPFGFQKILEIYKSYGVSPHYIITREGKIYHLVKDADVAYHAGESKTPDGRDNVNKFSLGIEIINSKTEGPSDAQYVSLKKLLTDLKAKYSIKYVLGHSDIAPGRKDDPWKFEWGRMK